MNIEWVNSEFDNFWRAIRALLLHNLANPELSKLGI